MDIAYLQQLQKSLVEHDLDGWLMYDISRSNPWPYKVLNLDEKTFLTRKWCFFIPRQGEAVVLKHVIESQQLNDLPAKQQTYLSWQDFEESIKEILKGKKRIAMEYSSFGRLASVSKVEAGMVDLVRSHDVEVVSSSSLLQLCCKGWTKEQWSMHQQAAGNLDSIANETFSRLSNNLKNQKTTTEYEVQQWIVEGLTKADMIWEGDPICAAAQNSADPHYQPNKVGSREIAQGDVVLIDLWGKQQQPGAVYADITRMAVAANAPTPFQEEIFNYVCQAQKKATQLVKSLWETKKTIAGFQIDECCRKVIEDAGYGRYFIHRTGHNIDTQDHGDGAHLDSLETFDERLLLENTCFSIEPGIYLPEKFGVRLEYDVFLHQDHTVTVTGGSQEEFVALL
jgi:Xaa-Pro dipeptidase